MIFQHTYELVLRCKKTQTRRIVKPYHRLLTKSNGTSWVDIQGKDYDRRLYVIGNTYAVQPGRGKKAVARIEITGIRQEDVRHISCEDAKAEGFEHPFEFLCKWSEMHGKLKFYFDPNIVDYRVWHNKQWQTMSYQHVEQLLMVQPEQYYQAWVLEFRLI